MVASEEFQEHLDKQLSIFSDVLKTLTLYGKAVQDITMTFT